MIDAIYPHYFVRIHCGHIAVTRPTAELLNIQHSVWIKPTDLDHETRLKLANLLRSMLLVKHKHRSTDAYTIPYILGSNLWTANRTVGSVCNLSVGHKGARPMNTDEWRLSKESVRTRITQARSDFDNCGGLDALVSDLLDLSNIVATYDPADLTEYGCDEPTIDVRLRYHNGCWSILSGDSSYDQDHRGHWGSSSVGLDLSEDDAKSIAMDLLSQVLESLAQAE